MGYLLLEITNFCKKYNITESRFGRDSVNDPRLISDLRNGRSISPKREEKVRTYIKDKETQTEIK